MKNLLSNIIFIIFFLHSLHSQTKILIIKSEICQKGVDSKDDSIYTEKDILEITIECPGFLSVERKNIEGEVYPIPTIPTTNTEHTKYALSMSKFLDKNNQKDASYAIFLKQGSIKVLIHLFKISDTKPSTSDKPINLKNKSIINISPYQYQSIKTNNSCDVLVNNRFDYDPCCNTINYLRKSCCHQNEFKYCENCKLEGKDLDSATLISSCKKCSHHFYTVTRKCQRVRVGEEMIFRVTNINHYKYNIKISDTTVSSNIDLNSVGTFFDTWNLVKPFFQGSNTTEITEIKFITLFCTELAQLLTNLKNTGDCGIIPQLDAMKAEIRQQLTQKWAEEGLSGNIDEYELMKKTQKYIQQFNNSGKNKDSVEVHKSMESSHKTLQEYINLRFDVSYIIPQIPNHDELILTVDIQPKDGVSGGIIVNKQAIRIPIMRGFKVDVSPGFYWSTLSDHSFIFRPDSIVGPSSTGADSVYQSGQRIINTTNGTGEFGISALVHFYTRWGRFVNVSLNAGAAFNFIGSPKPRLMLGSSLLLGRNNRFTISAGAIFGPVDRLSNEYIGQTLINTTATSVNTRLEMAAGFYMSIAFNIPTIRRLEKK